MWHADDELDRVSIADVEVVDVDAPGLRLLDCTLSSVLFSSPTTGLGAGEGLERSTWRGTRLHQVRFVATPMAGAHWVDVSGEQVALAGVELLRSTWRKVHLRHCLLDSVNLRGARWEDVVLEDCVLRDVDLGGAQLTRARLAGCTIERLDLTRTTLTAVDLRGSRIGVARGWERLRGAVIDHGQLAEISRDLAATLGITVEG